MILYFQYSYEDEERSRDGITTNCSPLFVMINGKYYGENETLLSNL